MHGLFAKDEDQAGEADQNERSRGLPRDCWSGRSVSRAREIAKSMRVAFLHLILSHDDDGHRDHRHSVITEFPAPMPLKGACAVTMMYGGG
jgi:hypothetical protein